MPDDRGQDRRRRHLLRPADLLEARERRDRGLLTAAQFKRVEDGAVDAALRLQEDAGLDVVTDGEMRRLSFQSQMTEAVEGFGEWDLDAFSGASGARTSSAR